MTLPRHDDMEVPLLQEIIAAGGAALPGDMYKAMLNHFPDITAADLVATLPGTGDNRWQNSIRRTRHRLVLKGDISRLPRGEWHITDQGRRRVAETSVVDNAGAGTTDTGGAADGSFNPTSLEDARQRTERAIIQRQGQGKFRETLLKAYGYRCAITDCDAVPALEAAHIIGYLGPKTNHVTNGLLLRADIHTLFDLGLLAVDTLSMSVLVAQSLAGTVYGELAGKPFQLPQDVASRPNKAALDEHRADAGW